MGVSLSGEEVMTFMELRDVEGDDYTINVGNVSYIEFDKLKGNSIFHFKATVQTIVVDELQYKKFISLVNSESRGVKR